MRHATMNNLFDRVKQGVKQATQQLREVITSPSGSGASSSSSSSSSSLSFSSSSGLYNSASRRDVLVSLVHSVCSVIDEYAISDEADTVEGDRALYESNAREYLRKIIELLVEDGLRWVDCVAGRGPDGSSVSGEVELDSIDAFLQTNAMHELCRRAGRDLPRGCLPMILAFTSSLLKQVRYPLLPHQTIYKPLNKLLSISCRLEAFIPTTAYNKSSTVPERTLEAANYNRRVDTALCHLLGTLWKKAADNPAVLDFFIAEDTRKEGGSNNIRFAPQMDVLSALLPLVQRPRVGQLARDAVLVALSLHDVRVDTFLVHHTTILPSLAESLGQQFTIATSNPVSNKAMLLSPFGASADFAQANSAHSVPGGIASSPAVAPLNRSVDTRGGPVDTFLHTLRFFCLVLVAASPEFCLTREPPPSLETVGTDNSVRAAACNAYTMGFLEGCLRPLLSNLGDELASVTATSLLRYLLRELELFAPDCALLALTVRFLLNLPGNNPQNLDSNRATKRREGSEADFVCGLVLRSSSMFPQVSLTSTTLVSALLQLSSLEEAFMLLAKGADSVKIVLTSIPTSSLQEQLDVRVGNVCKSLAAKAVAATPSSPSASSYTQAWIAHAYLSSVYTDAAANEVLARLARSSVAAAAASSRGSLNSHQEKAVGGLLEYLHRSFSLCEVSDFLQRDWAAPDECSAILGLVKRRLGCFLGLKLEEQVAATGLVSQVLSLFCTAIVSATEVDNAQGGRCLDYLQEVIRLVELLWFEVAKPLADVQDLETKGIAMTQLLLSATSTQQPDIVHVKLFEKESPRTVRMLETAVLLREMLAQAGGYLHASQRLRIALADPAGPFGTSLFKEDDYAGDNEEEDEWDREQRQELDATESSGAAVLGEIEAAFAREFEECVLALALVVSS